MPLGRFGLNLNIAGMTINSSVGRTKEGQIAVNPADGIPVATAGVLTTRTDNDTGVVTIATPHSFVSGKVSLFWGVGDKTHCRSNVDMVVTNGSDATLAIDAGTGANLPVADTVVQIIAPTVLSFPLTTALAEMWAAWLSKTGLIELIDDSDVVQATIYLAAGEAELWRDGDNASGSFSNPLEDATVLASVRVSHNSTSVAAQFKMGVIFDATP